MYFSTGDPPGLPLGLFRRGGDHVMCLLQVRGGRGPALLLGHLHYIVEEAAVRRGHASAMYRSLTTSRACPLRSQVALTALSHCHSPTERAPRCRWSMRAHPTSPRTPTPRWPCARRRLTPVPVCNNESQHPIHTAKLNNDVLANS